MRCFERSHSSAACAGNIRAEEHINPNVPHGVWPHEARASSEFLQQHICESPSPQWRLAPTNSTTQPIGHFKTTGSLCHVHGIYRQNGVWNWIAAPRVAKLIKLTMLAATCPAVPCKNQHQPWMLLPKWLRSWDQELLDSKEILGGSHGCHLHWVQ